MIEALRLSGSAAPRSQRRGVFGRGWLKFLLYGVLLGTSVGSMANAKERSTSGKGNKLWRVYWSPHFELYSCNPDGESRELLHDFEVLRAVLCERFKLVERARLEFSIFYFNDPADLAEYRTGKQAPTASGAFYRRFPDRAVIALALSGDPTGVDKRRIYHEYIHHLFLTAGEELPMWMGEGLAELYAGFRLAGDQVEIGIPPTDRLDPGTVGKALPLETIFADNESPNIHGTEASDALIAESWALLDYWYCGSPGLASAADRFLRMARSQRGVTPSDQRTSFQENFGCDYPEMQEQVARYLRTGDYRSAKLKITAPRVARPETYGSDLPAKSDVGLRLEELAFRMNGSQVAKLALEDFSKRNPNDSRIWEILGAAALLQQDNAFARRCWEQAIAGGSRNPAVFRELGLMASRGWFQSFDAKFRLSPETVRELRALAQGAIALDPTQSASYELLAWVEAYADVPSTANVILVQQHVSSLRDKPRTLLALALVRLRLHRPEEAERVLDVLDSMEADAWTENAAKAVRAELSTAALKSLAP